MPATLLSAVPATPSQIAIPEICDALASKPASQNPACVYLESLRSEVSKRTMISPLNRIARIMAQESRNAVFETDFKIWQRVAWEKLTAYAVRVVMAKLDGSPATRNKALAAMKGVASAAWEMKLMDDGEFQRIKAIKGDSGSRELAGRFVPMGEVTDVLRASVSDSSPAGLRDAAMIALATVTGARRAEIASLQMAQIVSREDAMTTFRVIGKRNKERFLYVSGNACRMLRNWLAVRGEDAGAVFCAVNKGGCIFPAHTISTTALDKILRKRGEQAGIPDLDWHDFRRSTASNLLDAGADISTVAGILGHANVQTTARYDRRGERAKIKAAELISVPYVARK